MNDAICIHVCYVYWLITSILPLLCFHLHESYICFKLHVLLKICFIHIHTFTYETQTKIFKNEPVLYSCHNIATLQHFFEVPENFA